MTPYALLHHYFQLHRDFLSAPLFRNPGASRVPSSDVPGNVGLLCDVGLCLEALAAAQYVAIARRWQLWFWRDDADVQVASWERKAQSALRANHRGAWKQARRKGRNWSREAANLTSQLAQLERSQVYRDAMNAFFDEVEARDLISQAACGKGRGITGFTNNRWVKKDCT